MRRPYPWKCRSCREKMVNPVTVDYTTEMEHDGRAYTVSVSHLEILRCGNCQEEQLPDESYLKLVEALRQKAGLLTPSQITQKRETLGLSQKEFAHLLGVAAETVCRWESGGQLQQRVMNDFMRAFFEVPELREYLKRLRVGVMNGHAPSQRHETLAATRGTRTSDVTTSDISTPRGVRGVEMKALELYSAPVLNMAYPSDVSVEMPFAGSALVLRREG
jgi:putative zinc finger/helix-turn-helix YgiT family protein